MAVFGRVSRRPFTYTSVAIGALTAGGSLGAQDGAPAMADGTRF